MNCDVNCCFLFASQDRPGCVVSTGIFTVGRADGGHAQGGVLCYPNTSTTTGCGPLSVSPQEMMSSALRASANKPQIKKKTKGLYYVIRCSLQPVIATGGSGVS